MKKFMLAFALILSVILAACNNSEMSESNAVNQSNESNESNDSTQQETSSGYVRGQVQFPEDYTKGVNYTTVNRGNVREELFTSREAIEAIQNGEPIPDGTVVTLEIYREEELSHIFVMEKRAGWGNVTPEGTPQNGDWQYEDFLADGSVDYESDIGRCFSCHANRERDDYLNTFDEMESFDLQDVTAQGDSGADVGMVGIHPSDWEVMELKDSDKWRDLNNSSSDTIEGEELAVISEEEKEGMIQKVLMSFYFN